MSHETMLIAVAAAVGVLLVVLLGGGFRWPYEAKPLLTQPEQVVFQRLRMAFPELVVLAQVSLGQAVRIRASGRRRQELWGKVCAKSLDFVLCRPDFSLVAAVELDDKSHEFARQRARDREKDRVLEAAKVPLLRWKVGKIPSSEEMRMLILQSTAQRRPSSIQQQAPE